jgi:hypothetical protein
LENREIKQGLESSLQKVRENDSLLIQERAHERAICFRLGYYLQLKFDEYTVDAEYDRQVGEISGTRIKKALPNTSQGDKDIFPDLLLHRRGVNDHNLLAVEVKKAENLKGLSWDNEKLVRLSQPPYCYKVTAFVVVNGLESDPIFKIIWGGVAGDCATQPQGRADARSACSLTSRRGRRHSP